MFWSSSFQPSGMPNYEANFWSGFTIALNNDNCYTQLTINLSGGVYVRVNIDGNWSSWAKLN